jgi:hypothetical protein
VQEAILVLAGVGRQQLVQADWRVYGKRLIWKRQLRSI